MSKNRYEKYIYFRRRFDEEKIFNPYFHDHGYAYVHIRFVGVRQ